MALNSNVFIPLGIPVTERARMLGHSVETNLRKYSFAGKNSNGNILEVLNGYHPNRRFLVGHEAEDGASVVQWTTCCEPTEPAGETLKPLGFKELVGWL